MFSTMLTLFVLPAIYFMAERRNEKQNLESDEN